MDIVAVTERVGCLLGSNSHAVLGRRIMCREIRFTGEDSELNRGKMELGDSGENCEAAESPGRYF